MCRYINVSGLGPVKVYITCADQGIFIGGGGGGGGGGPDLTARKLALKLLTEVFQRGSFIFQGSIFFQGGGGDPNVNFYRNPYITCDFLSPPPSGSAHA